MTTYRVIAIANTTRSYFGVGTLGVDVRKNIVIEPHAPPIVRAGDLAEMQASVFNTTNTPVLVSVCLVSDLLGQQCTKETRKVITLPAGGSLPVKWMVQIPKNIESAEIAYTITVE